MFKVIESGSNRLDIEMSGKLDAESMTVVLDELVSKSENIENGKMLYVIIDFQLPTLSAIGIELSRLSLRWRAGAGCLASYHMQGY